MVAPLYDEIVEFLAGGTTPEAVVAFQPSEATQARIAELLQREKVEGLTADEVAELDHYLQYEHLMRLTKARARRHLARE